MKPSRMESVRPARRDVYERLSQRLEVSLERQRKANHAEGTLIENEKLTRARLALFGCAPK